MTIAQTDIVRKRSQLSDDASAYVRNLIMSGRLLPGESVRPEIIGDALGISTTPARESLQALRVEGFLQLLPRRGFIVAPLTGQDIRDLFTAQALVAGELAARATAIASAGDIAELDALHHELLAAAGRRDLTVLEEKNHAFHRQVNKIADSRKIAWVLGLIGRYVPHLFYSQIDGWPETTTADHNAIISAIKAGDAEAARAAMAAHITHSGELLATAFDVRAHASAAAEKA